MKLKFEYIILIIIIIAAGLYLANKKTNQTHYTLPELPAIEKKDITKLTVSSAADSYTLIAETDKWFLEKNHLPAQKSTIDTMLDIIADLKLSALVSEKESYARYELSEDTKTTVTVWTGESQAIIFDIGKPASSYRHTYIKLDSRPHVYLAEKNFQDTFSSDTDRLIDKTVFQTLTDQFSAIQANDGDKQLSLTYKTETPTVDLTKEDTPDGEKTPETKPEELWVAADNTPMDKTAVSDLIKALTGLKCEQFITDKTKDAYSDPVLTFTLTGDQAYTLSIYPATGDDAKTYPAVSSVDEHPFMLPSSRIDKLKTTLEKIKAAK